MAYKRYIKRNGKLYGPYTYESIRVGNKVIAKYIGNGNTDMHSRNKSGSVKRQNYYNVFYFILVFLGVFLTFFLFYNALFPITGKASFELTPSYNFGEPITGNLKLLLKQGELIPSSALVKIKLNEQEKTISLSELVSDNAINGSFYVEGKQISGQGEGYGLLGEKAGNEISFELEIIAQETEEQEETSQNETQAINETGQISEGTGGGASGGGGAGGGATEQPTQQEETPTEQPAETPSEETEIPEQPAEETPTEQPAETPYGSITGNVVAENTITGEVSKGNDFNYELLEGETARIIKAELNNENARDLISLTQEGRIITITTSYDGSGFGQDYLGNENKEISINLNNFNITAERGSLEASLIYENNELIGITKALSITANETLSNINQTNLTIETNLTLNLTLQLIKPIEDITIRKNSNYSLNLSEYFVNAESYSAFETENISISFEENNALIIPVFDFTGTGFGKITAIRGNETLDSEFNIVVSDSNITIKTIQYKARLNEKVKWLKNITLESAENITIELPMTAENISVRKIKENRSESISSEEQNAISEEISNETNIVENETMLIEENSIANETNEEINIINEQNETNQDEQANEISIQNTSITGNVVISIELEKQGAITKLFNKLIKALTGKVISEVEITNSTEETKELIIETNESENLTSNITYSIEYYTEAAYSIEENISHGQSIKIVGPDDVHYTNITAYSFIEETESYKVHLLWLDNGTRQEVSVSKFDTNNNSLIDYIEWEVPILSNQSYQLVLITKALKLDENRSFIEDIYNYVKEKDDNWTAINNSEYVRVTFEIPLDRTRDITLYARSNESAIVEVYLENGSEKIVSFENITSESWNKVYLTNLNENESYETFDLKVLGNLEIDYIVDPAIGTTGYINFTSPTPGNATLTANTSVVINVSLVRVNLSEFTWNLDNTNYTIYNNSLILMFNFDNISSLGEGGNKTADVSVFSNNGTCMQTAYGMNCNYNASGKYDRAIQLDGIDDYVNITSFSSFPTSSGTVAVWVKPGKLADYNDLIDISSSLSSNANRITFERHNGHNSQGCSGKSVDAMAFAICNAAASCTTTCTNTALSAGTWYYLTGTWNSTGIYIYNNGIFENFQAGSTTPSSATFGYIGNNLQGIAGRFFNGSIDELRIWNRSLTATEISQHYVSNLYKFNLTNWSFVTNQTATTEKVYNYYGYAKDASGNGNATETRQITLNGSIPQISYVAPTIGNNTQTGNSSIVINVSLTESNLNNFTWNWNATNYTIYDNSSLLVMFNFDNISSFGENDSHMKDISQYGNNGSMFNGAFYNASGKYDKALQFDGGNDYANITNRGYLPLGNANFSFELWAKPNVVGHATIYQVLLAYGTEVNNQAFYLINYAGENKFRFEWWGGGGSVSSATALQAGSWMHVAGVYNGTKSLIYINGNLENATAYTSSNLVNNFINIGNLISTASRGFNGSIDELRIWNRTLSASEIKQHYYSNLNKFNSSNWSFYTNESNLTAGTHTYYAHAKDNAGNGNVTETRQVVVDSSAPYFTGITNLTVNYNLDVYEDINATDETAFDCFKVNDTRFSINCSGDLKNTTQLAVDMYWLNITINDTTNNKNYSIIFVNVSNQLSVCGILNTTNVVYMLQNNVSASASCFNITASNVTLDCQNNVINYSNSAVGFGVESNSNSTKIKNCRIWQGGTSSNSWAIMFNPTSARYYQNEQTIFNNTIVTRGIAYAIIINNVHNLVIINNSLTCKTTGTCDGIAGVYTSSSNITIEKNWINATEYGITDGGIASNNWTIRNNTIIISSHSSATANIPAILQNGGVSWIIEDNSLLNQKIEYVLRATSNNIIRNNSITATAATSNVYALRILGSNNTIINNFINNSASGIGLAGTTIQSNNYFENNTINQGGTTTGSYGIGFQATADNINNTLKNTNIKMTSAGSYAVFVSKNNQNFTFIGSNITSTQASDIYINQTANGGFWNFTNVSHTNKNYTAGANGTLQVWWYATMNVTNATGQAVANTNVTLKDSYGVELFSNITTATGYTGTYLLKELNMTNSSTPSLNPHNITINDSGYTYYINDTNLSYSGVYTYVLTLVTAADATPPYFTGITNITINYNLDVYEDINATDETAFDCFKVNDTRFSINCSGDLKNTTQLAVNMYWLNITINDTTNNKNYSIIFVNVSNQLSVCGVLNTTNVVYMLQNNVSASGTCFNITAENITLDCQGYQINYSQSAAGYGVYSTANLTQVKNCKIVQGSTSGSQAIFYNLPTIATNFNYIDAIFNNTIKTLNTGCIKLTNSNNINITNNTMNCIGTTSTGYGIGTASVTNLSVTGNTINSSAYSVYDGNFAGVNWIIKNNYFNSSADGMIWASVAASSGWNIQNNVLVNYAQEVIIYLASSGHIVKNNNLTALNFVTTASSIRFEGSNSTFIGNFINASAGGIRFGGTSATIQNNNYFENNTIIQSGTRTSVSGISFATTTYGTNNTFKNTNILMNTASTPGVAIASPNVNFSFIDGNITSTQFSDIRINLANGGFWNFTNVSHMDRNYTSPTNGTLEIWWYATINVTNGSNALINNANVTLNDTFDNLIFNILTNASGITPTYLVKEVNYSNSSDYTEYNLYKILTNASGYNINSATNNITSSKIINVIVSSNTAPNNPSVGINSTDKSNKTSQNLNCYANITDPEGNLMNVSVVWYKQNVSILAIDYNNSYNNGVWFNAVLNSSNTTKYQNWSCEIRVHDGSAFSAWVNSSSLKILNTLPSVSFSSPADKNQTTNRTPVFSWTGSDDDADSLTYEINISCLYTPGGTCHAGDRYVNKDSLSSATSYKPTAYLEYLLDNNYFYNWTIRAYDGESFSAWLVERNISIISELIMSLPVQEVDFSNLTIGQSANTTTGSPAPLILRNDGNTYLNVSINFSTLFSSVAMPSSNYQFKINRTAADCFADSGTQTTWLNANSITAFAINRLNFTSGYQTGCRNATVDLLVTIPGNEMAGRKSSIITFISSLGEPGVGSD